MINNNVILYKLQCARLNMSKYPYDNILDEVFPATEAADAVFGVVLEVAMDNSRTSKRIGRITVDEEDSKIKPKKKFFSSMAKRARQFKVAKTACNEGVSSIHRFSCQAGFLKQRRHDNTSDRWVVLPVTAKHNFINTNDKNLGELIHSGFFAIMSSNSEIEPQFLPSSFKLHDDDRKFELSPGNGWPYGIDVAVGMPITYPKLELTEENKSFFLIRPDFQIKVNHRIGITLIQDKLVTANKAGLPENTSTDILKSLYGTPGEPHIYTGTVTDVGERHIEHDINTFESCSGAIIFLLNAVDQLEDVRPQDFGCAIAVHVGYSETLLSNIGFKLQSLNLQNMAQSLIPPTSPESPGQDQQPPAKKQKQAAT